MERKHVTELIAAVAHLDPPPTFNTAMRYLRHSLGDVAKAAQALEISAAWRAAEGVDDILQSDIALSDPACEELLERATRGNAVKLLECRDMEGRPIYYYDLQHLDVPHLLAAGITQRNIVRRFVRAMEEIVLEVDRSPCPPKGHLAVYDVTHLSPSVFLRSLDMWTEIAKLSAAHYPDVLGACLIMGAAPAASWVFDRVVPMLVDSETMPKVLLVSGDPAKALVDGNFLTEEQVQQFTPYGSKAKR